MIALVLLSALAGLLCLLARFRIISAVLAALAWILRLLTRLMIALVLAALLATLVVQSALVWIIH